MFEPLGGPLISCRVVRCWTLVLECSGHRNRLLVLRWQCGGQELGAVHQVLFESHDCCVAFCELMHAGSLVPTTLHTG